MPRRRYELSIEDENDLDEIVQALNASVRRKIMCMLRENSYSIADLAKILKMPIPTVSFHINILKKAGFIHVTVKRHSRGNAKIISRRIDRFSIDFREESEEVARKQVVTEIPIGSYVDLKVGDNCGMADENNLILWDDDASVLYAPERVKAQIFWTNKGYVEYRLPNYMFKGRKVKNVVLSMELCSEAPNYRLDWESEITFWINGKEVTTYVCPGDFGGRRGRLNPAWWSDYSTQYGIMKTLKITEEGAYLDEVPVNTLNIQKLHMAEGDYVTLRIGVKEDSKKQGGFNLFGAKFGDYEQGILYTVEYED